MGLSLSNWPAVESRCAGVSCNWSNAFDSAVLDDGTESKQAEPMLLMPPK